MKSLKISRRVRSQMVWSVLYDNPPEQSYADELISLQRARCGMVDAPATLRPLDVQELSCIARAFQPEVVVEVGTYIGVSSVTIANEMRRGEIHTCDSSSDWVIQVPDRVQIHQYPRQSSEMMFSALAEKKIKADMVYLDGRLQGPDVEQLKRLVDEETIFVMDDFEGIEKGVYNALMLTHGLGIALDLITPRTQKSKTALMLQSGSLAMVAQ